MRIVLVFIVSIVGLAAIAQPNFAFTQRNTWDGPFDIRMISAPNLQPVILNKIEAERGATSTGFLLAEKLIDTNIHRRTGDLFDINNRFKDGSDNSIFAQYDIPMPAILCTGSLNTGTCFLGLDTANNSSSCAAPAIRYESNPMFSEGTYVSMTYADYDKDLTTFSSSMAFLDISACSEIESAYLYWSGNFQTTNKPITLVPGVLNSYNGIGNTVFNVSNTKGIYDRVKFKLPGQNYQDVTATTLYSSTRSYVCVADVTTQLQGLQGGGEFWVGNLSSYPIEGDGGSTSGWTLVVVFKSPLSPPRLISLWDGFKNISQNGTEVFTLTGLQAPSGNNFKSYVGFATLDGENLATQLGSDDVPEGLGFKTNNGVAYIINPFETDQQHYKLYTEDGLPANCNGANNIQSNCRTPLYNQNWCSVFDGVSSSHITSYNEQTNTNGNEIIRLPNNTNTLGYDAHHMKLPDGAVSPNATSATLTVSAGPQGSTLPFLAYLAIERLQPKLTLIKTADKNSTSLGTSINYTFKIKNEGNAPSLGNDHLLDTLDLATNYVNVSLTVDKNIVSMASSTNDFLDILIRNPIAVGDSISINFEVIVIPYAQNPALFNPPTCKRTIENTAYIKYNTTDSGVLFSKSNSNDCGIGSETKIVLIDAQLSSSNQIEIGKFDGCLLEGSGVKDELIKKMIEKGYPISLVTSLDLRNKEYDRIRATDVFEKVMNTVDYYLINDAGSGTSCQEVYHIVFECATCSVQVTSPDTLSICSGEPINYAIALSQVGANSTWSSLANPFISTVAISNQTGINIADTLNNTSSSYQIVNYTIIPQLANCISVPFVLKVKVKPIPDVVLSFNYLKVCEGDSVPQISFNTISDSTVVSWLGSSSDFTSMGTGGIGIIKKHLIEGVGNGFYELIPTRQSCVGEIQTVQIEINSFPNVQINSNDLDNRVCNGSDIQLTFSGAQNYIISPIVNQNTNFKITKAEQYILEGTDANGCKNRDTLTIEMLPLPKLTSSMSQMICDNGTESAKVQFDIIGTATFDFELNSKSGLQNISNHTLNYVELSVNQSDTFFITRLTDGNLCKALELGDSIFIAYKPSPQVIDTLVYCNPLNPTNGASGLYTYFIELEMIGGEGNYEVNGINGLVQSNRWKSIAIEESKITNLEINDGNNCEKINISTLGITCSCPDFATLAARKDSVCISGDSITTSLVINLQSLNTVNNWAFRLIDSTGLVVGGHDYTNNQFIGTQLIVKNIPAGKYQIQNLNGNCDGPNSPIIPIYNYDSPIAQINGNYSICDDKTDLASLKITTQNTFFPASIVVLNSFSQDTTIILNQSETNILVDKAGVYQLKSLKDSRTCTASDLALTGTAEVSEVTSPIALIYSIDNDTNLGFMAIKEKFVIQDEIEVLANQLPENYIGNWQIQYFGIVSDAKLNNGRISNLVIPAIIPDTSFGDRGISKLLWIVLDQMGICEADSSIGKIIQVSRSIIPKINDTTICESNLPIKYTSANVLAIIEKSFWIDIDGAIGTAGDTIQSTVLTISNKLKYGRFRFLYVLENDFFIRPLLDTFFVQIDQNPTKSIALSDLKSCKEEEIIGANIPIIGQGSWVCDKGTVQNSTSNITVVSNLIHLGNTTCIWSITNGVCPPSLDDQAIFKLGNVTTPIITVNNNSSQSIFNFCIDAIIRIKGNVPDTNKGEKSSWVTLSSGSVINATGSEPYLGELISNKIGQETLVYSIESNVVGCEKNADTVVVTINNRPDIVIFGDTAICENQVATFNIQSTDITAVKWYKNNIEIAGEVTDSYTTNSMGNYWAKIDNGICPIVSSDTILLRVDKVPTTEALVNEIKYLEVIEGEMLALEAFTNGENFTWAIMPERISLVPNQSNFISTESLIGLNKIILNSTNGLCSSSDTVRVFVKAKVKSPNVFTVNGDGINETFKIIGIESYPDATVFIFDRWGGKVFESKNYASNEWDGANLPASVYYLLIQFNNEKNSDITGCVHLFR